MVPELSRLAAPGSAAEPLAPAEITEMKEHLAFVRTYKDVLRLKLNAAEDLLVNGQREPTDRGICRHLLGKVDHALIEKAVAREPLCSDPAARARMLAGAIRLTADVGVLLGYLETLTHVRSRTDAAQAFAEVVRRIDFESLSATRLARLLRILIDTFVDQERVQVLFSLLASAAFRRAFDAAATALPHEVAEVFAPLRAVHRHLLEDSARSGAPVSESPALLATGIRQVLSAPDPILRGYAEPLRAGILELALGAGVDEDLGDRAASTLLQTLPRGSRTYARLATQRAAQLLARHTDDRARNVLEDLRRAQPGFRTAERWLAALDARRIGRIALRGDEPERGRLTPGFWLDGQRPVWIRTAATLASERLAAEARLQARLGLPGVAPVVEHGVGSGIPYVAVAGEGRPLTLDRARPVELGTAFSLLSAAARVLRALSLVGVAIPDAAPERFLFSPATVVILADLDGAQETEPDVAARQHAALAVTLARELLRAGSTGITAEIYDALDLAAPEPPAIVDLIARVDRTALHHGRHARTPR